MNSITRRMVSGGLVAGLTLLATAAHAQARSGAWTRNAPDGDWQMPGRDFSLQRFSPLAQISTTNVAGLKAAWSFSTGTLRGHEGTPLVIGTCTPPSRTSSTRSIWPRKARR
jgi:glucose dehydrogenase